MYTTKRRTCTQVAQLPNAQQNEAAMTGEKLTRRATIRTELITSTQLSCFVDVGISYYAPFSTILNFCLTRARYANLDVILARRRSSSFVNLRKQGEFGT